MEGKLIDIDWFVFYFMFLLKIKILINNSRLINKYENNENKNMKYENIILKIKIIISFSFF